MIRRISDLIFSLLCLLAVIIGLGFLFAIIYALVERGLPAFWTYPVFTESVPPPNEPGGLLNAIVGSLIITGLGMAMAIPFGVLIATYMTEFGAESRLSSAIRFFNDVLLSAPSILLGLFVYAFLVGPLGGYSALSGAVALALIAIPMIVRTTDGVLQLLPREIREAAVALGVPRWKVTVLIVWRAALGGIITAILLATARIAGETAPLLFTAFSNNFLSFDLTEPMGNLPVVMFNFALSPYQNWQDLAWAASLLITVTILAMSIIARLIVGRRM
ncbi:MAG: phosphate ABC transporter permease PstA [Pseudomonadota bacterium]